MKETKILSESHKEAIAMSLRAFNDAKGITPEVAQENRKEANRQYRASYRQMTIFIEPEYHEKLKAISKKLRYKSLHAFSKAIMYSIADKADA